VVKNKLAPPFRLAEFDIMFGRGISKEGDIIDLGVALGLLKKAGTFFTYGDIKLGPGRENAKEHLRQHTDLALKLEREIRSAAGSAAAIGMATKEVFG